MISQACAGERAELDGVWQVEESVQADRLELTEAGKAAQDSYDFLTDDPAMQCIPASFTRIMMTPSPLMEIRRHDDHIEINYEFMDVKRRVKLDPELNLDDAPFSVPEFEHLGRSVARYEGEDLVIDTVGQHAGVLTTLMGFEGLPQSDQMRTEERYVPNGDHLQVFITHHDPVNYSGPMIMQYNYSRVDLPILEWGCEVEEAGYEQFLE